MKIDDPIRIEHEGQGGSGPAEEREPSGESTGEPAGADRQGDAVAKLAAAEERAAQERDRALRAQAELDNVRKRTARELSEGLKYAGEQMVRELLPVIDNLERALSVASAEPAAAALRDGVSLTLNQFLGVLKRFGAVPVEALGRPFDPNLHEAVQRVESDQPAGTVVAEYQKGYTLNGRLVRASMVAVAAPAAGEAAGGETLH